MALLKSVQDKLLTQSSNMLVPYGYISESILPVQYVEQKTGKLGKFGTDHLRIEAALAGGRGKARRVDSVVRSTSTYTIQTYMLEDIITPDDIANVSQPFDAELDVSMALTSLLWLVKEQSLANTLTSTSTITQNTTLSGTSQFSDYNNSDPISIINTANATVRNACGFAPNKVAMDWQVYNQIATHPQCLDFLGFKYNRPGGLSIGEVAKLFKVPEEGVLIGQAVYESAAEGQASSIAPVWGKSIVMMYAPSDAMRYQQSLGYRLQLNSQRGGPRSIFKYPIFNPPNSTGIICQDAFSQFLSNVNCAYLIKNSVA